MRKTKHILAKPIALSFEIDAVVAKKKSRIRVSTIPFLALLGAAHSRRDKRIGAGGGENVSQAASPVIAANRRWIRPWRNRQAMFSPPRRLRKMMCFFTVPPIGVHYTDYAWLPTNVPPSRW